MITTSLLNETRMSFSRNAILSGLPELSLSTAQNVALPQFILSPTRSWAAAADSITRAAAESSKFATTTSRSTTTSPGSGSSRFKFGGEVVPHAVQPLRIAEHAGRFPIHVRLHHPDGRNDGTGDALASFMLGLPAIASRAVGPSRIDGRQWSYSFYAQDDFNLTPQLTLNFGCGMNSRRRCTTSISRCPASITEMSRHPGRCFRRREDRVLQANDVHLRTERHAERLRVHGSQQLCAACRHRLVDG